MEETFSKNYNQPKVKIFLGIMWDMFFLRKEIPAHNISLEDELKPLWSVLFGQNVAFPKIEGICEYLTNNNLNTEDVYNCEERGKFIKEYCKTLLLN